MPVEFRHERLAKPHNFVVRFTFYVEIGATFGTTHRQSGQAVLECLLECEKLQDAEVDARVEPQPAFVRADRVVVLHTVATVDANVSIVILPAHAKNDDAIRFGNSPKYLHLVINFLVFNVIENIGRNLVHGLGKFSFVGIATYQTRHELFQVDMIDYGHLLFSSDCCCPANAVQLSQSLRI